jgi:hypothetical protein
MSLERRVVSSKWPPLGGTIIEEEERLTNRQDKYISVLGSLKVFGGKRHISATHVRLITDPNEIAHHALKAQWVSLSLRGASEGGGAAAVSFHFCFIGQ